VFLVQLGVATISALSIGAVDQLTKRAALQFVVDGSWPPESAVRFEIQCRRHAGIGRFVVPRSVSVLIGCLTSAAALALVVFAGPLPPVSVVGLGLAVGGGASNVADLIVRGGVVDFVTIGRWPTFNLADAALCFGLALTAIGLL